MDLFAGVLRERIADDSRAFKRLIGGRDRAVHSLSLSLSLTPVSPCSHPCLVFANHIAHTAVGWGDPIF